MKQQFHTYYLMIQKSANNSKNSLVVSAATMLTKSSKKFSCRRTSVHLKWYDLVEYQKLSEEQKRELREHVAINRGQGRRNKKLKLSNDVDTKILVSKRAIEEVKVQKDT